MDISLSCIGFNSLSCGYAYKRFVPERRLKMAGFITDYATPMLSFFTTSIGTLVSTITSSWFLMVVPAIMVAAVVPKILRKLLGSY